ncbi:hypothetical protein DB30_03512 [Enhygromyxa salina]|uniref:Uncharacterized protein n=1 Tax=Enhygromyxa salina TaxID=215803 RepID=A0A0C1ZI40_9BACT|nr:hypothetical protein DB30_03512 [Enhygromyxa salina]
MSSFAVNGHNDTRFAQLEAVDACGRQRGEPRATHRCAQR